LLVAVLAGFTFGGISAAYAGPAKKIEKKDDKKKDGDKDQGKKKGAKKKDTGG